MPAFYFSTSFYYDIYPFFNSCFWYINLYIFPSSLVVIGIMPSYCCFDIIYYYFSSSIIFYWSYIKIDIKYSKLNNLFWINPSSRTTGGRPPYRRPILLPPRSCWQFAPNSPYNVRHFVVDRYFGRRYYVTNLLYIFESTTLFTFNFPTCLLGIGHPISKFVWSLLTSCLRPSGWELLVNGCVPCLIMTALIPQGNNIYSEVNTYLVGY